MSSTKPMRVDGELFNAAKSVGAAANRSAAQQISHWARIGRELEASGDISARDIQRVLAGETSYDTLGDRTQALLRANWEEQIAERLAKLDLAAEFIKAGRPWSGADDQGGVAKRSGGGDS